MNNSSRKKQFGMNIGSASILLEFESPMGHSHLPSDFASRAGVAEWQTRQT